MGLQRRRREGPQPSLAVFTREVPEMLLLTLALEAASTTPLPPRPDPAALLSTPLFTLVLHGQTTNGAHVKEVAIYHPCLR